MKVKNFAGFMKSKVNESAGEYSDEMNAGYMAGANPEDDPALEIEGDQLEGEEGEGEEEEEFTLETAKAMIEDLTERVEALEPDTDDEEGEGEEEEGEEGEGEEGDEMPAE